MPAAAQEPQAVSVHEGATVNVTEPLRVTHVINGLARGGAEAALLRLIEDTGDQIRHSIVALTGHGEVRPEYWAAVGGRAMQLGAQRGRGSLRMAWDCARAISASRPELIHGWLKHSCLLAGLSACVFPSLWRVPLVWGVRDTVDAELMSATEMRSLRLGRWLSPRCGLMVSNSRRAAEQMTAGGYRPRESLVIHNGVEIPDERRLREWRSATRSSLGIEDSRFVVLYLGSTHPSKGPGCLLDAIETLKHERPDSIVLRAGRNASPEERSDDSDRLEASPLIRHVGEVSDPMRWIAASDALVLPSRREGCPNVVLEALACGVPVAATDVGDVREIVGDFGRVVPIGAGPELGRALLALASLGRGDRERCRVGARERIRAGHERTMVARRYLQHYERLVGRRISMVS